MADLDPVKFGEMMADIANIKERLAGLEKTIQPLSDSVAAGKGILLVLNLVSAGIGAGAAEVLHWLHK